MGFDRRNYSSRQRATIIRGGGEKAKVKNLYPGLKPVEANKLRRNGISHRELLKLSDERLAEAGLTLEKLYPGLTDDEIKRFRKSGMTHSTLVRLSAEKLKQQGV